MRWLRRAKQPKPRARSREGATAWVAPAAMLCLVAGGAALLVGAPWMLWRAGLVQTGYERATGTVVQLTGLAGLTLQDVLVEGRLETQPQQILAALAVRRGMPILAIDPREARQRLERIPWVREAAVERRLPGELHVRLVERVPMALWQNNGKFVLIDLDGALIEAADVSRFGGLPHIVGENAGAAAGELLRMLDAVPLLKDKVASAVRVGGRRWNVQLKNGIEVRLPAEQPQAAWTHLAALEREHAVLSRDLKAIDMRFPDRLVIKVGPAAAPARAGQRNT